MNEGRYVERKERGSEDQENEWEKIRKSRDLEWGDSQESMQMTLAKMPISGDMEPEEATSCTQV